MVCTVSIYIYVIYRLMVSLYGKNCDLGPEASVSIFRPRSQFFPIQTDHKLVNNLFIFPPMDKHIKGPTRGKAGRVFFIKKIYENFGKSLAFFRNSWKSSETVQKCFPLYLWVFKIFGKSSEAFRNLWKFSENFRNDSNVIFRCFYFLKFLENLQKCSEIFGNFWKTLETVQK